MLGYFAGWYPTCVTDSERKPLRAVKLRMDEYAYNYTMRGICAFFVSTPAVMVTLTRDIILPAILIEISLKVNFTICPYVHDQFCDHLHLLSV